MTRHLSTKSLLVIGVMLTCVTGPRWHIDWLAWLAPVPYLLVARRLRRRRGWLGLFGVMVLASLLQISTIATPPVPLIAIVGFGPPLAVMWFTTTLTGELVRRRSGELAGIATFAAATAVMSWVGYHLTELGAWMSPTTSQVDQLALMQVAAIGGLGLLGALMGWTAATVSMVLGAERGQRRRAPVVAIAAVLVGGLGWGAMRLDAPVAERSVIVAGITTDLGLGPDGMPTAEQLAANTDTLFARTETAAARGARLVVWNEVATVIDPADEPAFVARGQAVAKRLGIDLVLGYAPLVRRDPLLLDNKFVFITDAGEVIDTYQKHHPVPGEPSIRGTAPLRVLERPYAKVAGAICYDYDFPALAREHARAGAELVVVPSSDWQGINPVHTGMQRVRAIEGGFSLVRVTRWGASGAFDARGRQLAWMPAEQQDHTMIANVPIGRVPTIYRWLGDYVVAIAGAYLAIALLLAFRRNRIALVPA